MEVSILNGENKADYISLDTLISLFRNTVANYPTKTALQYGDTKLTYQELNQWSDLLAISLSHSGLSIGDTAGVLLPRGLELHVVVLGIIKTGAAYVPIDCDTPIERVKSIGEEAKIKFCVTDKDLSGEFPTFKTIHFEDLKREFDHIQLDTEVSCEDTAYIIYTSGTTGKPKGIPITHAQICHLVKAEQGIFQINSDDKVYQGFSIAFDMWCEETWISYFVGATLWIADNITSKSIDELPTILENAQITVFHAVPSLLAAMPRDAKTVRIVNSGGEACTHYVLEKWAKDGRKFFNSYGPTETTVSASIADLKYGDLITIGNTLPNYSMAIVDEALNPVKIGVEGELVISGIGVSIGYLERPDLTNEKFIKKPSSLSSLYGDRIYKTGDIARLNSHGNIEFNGRNDDQVKYHGFRIELGAIESALCAISSIKEAACKVVIHENNVENLVAFVVIDKTITFSEQKIKNEVAKVLPKYMVPTIIETIETMPRLSSGKVNRKELLYTTIENLDFESRIDENLSNSEKVILLLKKYFTNEEINLNKDFFDDLGGDSFTAALFVSELRESLGFSNVSIRDIYMHKPLQKLVDFWEKENEEHHEKVEEKENYYSAKNLQYFACNFVQTLSLLFIFSLFSLQIFLPYLGFSYTYNLTKSYWEATTFSFLIFCLMPILFFVLTVALKKIIIGTIKEGDYPVWGVYYFKWWFFKSFQKLTSIDLLSDTPLYSIYLKFLGVKIGKDAQFSSFNIGAEDLVTIGDGVSISSYVNIDNAWIENGFLKFRKVHIGNHVCIGSSSVISGGVEMQDWSELNDLSCALNDTIIYENEIWEGSPAHNIRVKTQFENSSPLIVSLKKKRIFTVIYSLLILVFPLARLIPLLPVLILVHDFEYFLKSNSLTYLYFMPLLAVVYVVGFILQTAISNRILQHRMKAGTYDVYSTVFMRKWLSEQVMNLSLEVLHPIYATIYIAPLFRLFGAKVGQNTEISTATGITHCLFEMGDGGFIADTATIGEFEVKGLRCTLKHTKINNDTFIGNSAVLPQGYELRENMLIGVLSTPPNPDELKDSEYNDWFGSPSIPLPNRQVAEDFPISLTLNPSFNRKIMRGTIEFIRIILPTTLIIFFSIQFIDILHTLILGKEYMKLMLTLPFLYLGIIGLPCVFITIALKWIVIGKYKEEQLPMWTLKVWKSEAITTIYEALAVPFLLDFLTGTRWLPIFMRFFGVKIGKRTVMNTTDITEFDNVRIGDETILNDDSGPQTHLFEDRIMKIGKVTIGKKCSIGSGSIILYNTSIEDETRILALSLVMKGETLSGNKTWGGSPVRPL